MRGRGLIFRLPFAPLERWVLGGQTDRRDALQYLAWQLGVSASHISKYRAVGLSTLQADQFACRVNIHPSLIWPEWGPLVDQELGIDTEQTQLIDTMEIEHVARNDQPQRVHLPGDNATEWVQEGLSL